MKTVYLIREYIKNEGAGRIMTVCADKESVVDYLTHKGHRHGRLVDEHDIYVKDGADVLDFVEDAMVLQFIPDVPENKADDIYALLGRESERTSDYYMITTCDYYEK